MLPETLDEWTLAAIKELVRSGYQESESFDFKWQLPHPKANKEKAGLEDDCCAFANSNGGFLVFGVQDAQKATGEDRIVGISLPDFQSKFGNYPAACQPSVNWQLKPNPIHLHDGKLIQVIYIPSSFRGPHAVERDDKWVFKKRTNKGNEDMSYDEIRLAFLHHHDRLRRVTLLKAELEEIRYEAQQHLLMIDGQNTNFPARFELSVLDDLWSDIYPILHASPEITESITQLRRLCRTVNRNAEIIHQYAWRGVAANLLNGAKRSNSESLHVVIDTATDALGALKLLFP